MELQPETEAKLNELAQRIHRDRNELLEEAVNNLVYNEWFERKVNASIAATERGEIVPDHEVCAWVEERTSLRSVTIAGEPPVSNDYS